MAFNFPAFTIAFAAGVLLSVILSFVVLTRHPAPGSAPFIFFTLAIGWWLFCNSLEFGAIDFNTKVLWGKMMYFGSLSMPVFWLSFTLEYTGSSRKYARNLLLLFFIPLIALIFIWTNDIHHLFWTNIHPGPFDNILVYEHGPVFYMQLCFTYLLIVTGLAILLLFAWKKSGILRYQLAGILIGTLIPIIGSIIYLLNLNSNIGLYIEPFSFILAGLIYTVTIFRFRFMDIIPVARGTLMETIPDGILVLDDMGLIADINPAAEKFTALSAKTANGQPIDKVWPLWSDVVQAGADRGGRTVLTSKENPNWKYLEISITPIKKGAAITGRLAILRDISVRRMMQQSLRESEARYSALIDQLDEEVLIIQNGVCVFANKPVIDLTGYRLEDLTGKPLYFLIAEEDRELVKENHRRRLAGEQVPNNYEIRIKTRSNKIIKANMFISLITYDGNPAFILTLHDIKES